MAAIICQTCNKSNPDTLEICQFCGTPLKNRGTEPLATIHPGEMPVKQQTSELESTLPGWLRDMRKGDDSQGTTPSMPAASQPVKPAAPPKKEASPLDFLAGLSQLDDEEEAEPDWLANLRGNSPSDSAPSGQSQSQSPVDWLSGLTGDAPPAPATPPVVKSEQPVNWLSGFEADSQPQTPQPEKPDMAWGGFNDSAEEPDNAVESTPEETPDWLAALKAQDTNVNVPARPKEEDFSFDSSDVSSGDFPDWLSNLGGESTSTPAAASASDRFSSSFADNSLSAKEDTSDDWLAGLSQSSVESVRAAAEPPSMYTHPASVGNDSSAPTGEFPDWLSSLGSESASAPQKSESVPSAPAMPIAAQDSGAADGDFHDWLSNLGGESTPAPQKAEPAASFPSMPIAAQDSGAADGDFPDWLSNLGGESTSAPQKTEPATSAPAMPMAAQDSGAADGDFPDWLSNLGGESTSAPQKSESVTSIPAMPMAAQDSGAADSDFPDWLSNLGGESTSAPEKPLPPVPMESKDSSFDWTAAQPDESPTIPAVETPSGNQASIFANLLVDDGIGWLEPLAEDKPATTPAATPSVSKEKAFSTGSLEGLTPLKKTDEVPDWLAGLNATTPKKAAEPKVDLPNTGAFDWLSSENQAESKPLAAESKPTGPSQSAVEKPKAPAELPSSAFLPDSSQNLDSIFSMEMPDWLSGFTPSEPAAPAQEAVNEEPQPAALQGADLPSWVQAMRPIESVVAGTQSSADDQVVEQVGPLAGLRSVLPAQANAQAVRKPKAYSIKLQVDSVQLAQATLLENLIASEAESRPVITASRVVNFRSLRWTIGLVLLLVVLFAGIARGGFFPLPDASSPEANIETTAFYKSINDLPDSAKVLVIFDYQPGYAGEMEQAGGPVIGHLMSKNARLAFVSTSPTGVLMNERMMDAQKKVSIVKYTKGIEYVDLGYLPGDAAGIQVFAETPDVLGNDYQADQNLWMPVTGLDHDNKLSNFDAAIVLTDNPDTGRIWIEQAGPALLTKPLLMVVSAQAAPMILPYYESKQIKGLLSGLVGGAFYEVLTGQLKGNASFYYWDSYGAGMIAAELLIVIGAVWALIQRLQMRRAEQNREEDEE